MLAAFLLAVLLPQVDWIDAGRRYVKAWNAGKVNLQAPVALDRPGFLDPRNAKIVELVKARGDKFHWTAEAELSFICSGLAAAVGDDGADVLWQLGLVRIGNDAVAELRNRAAAKRQPWLVRHTVLATIAKGSGTRYAARAVDVLGRFGQEDFDPIAANFACAVLARCGGIEHRATVEKLLASDEVRVRGAALAAIRAIGASLSLKRLVPLLDNEKSVAVRCAIWHALGGIVSALGDPDKRDPNEHVDRIIAHAVATLKDLQRPLVEGVAVCRFIWNARPLEILRELPDCLAAHQETAGGHATLRWWIWGLLNDMHGTGTERRRNRRGQLGTGFTAGANEPEKWKQFLAGRRRLYALRRGRETSRPPFPAGTPTLFGLPLFGKRIRIIVDCSEASGAPFTGVNRDGSTTEKTTVHERIAEELRTVLAKLPATTTVFVECWSKRGKTLASKSRERLADLVGEQRPRGPSNPSGALLRHIRAAQPIETANIADVDSIYWLCTSPPTAGTIQSPQTLVDVLLSAQPSCPVPIHVALFADRRKARFGYKLSRLLRGLSKKLRRLGEESGGSYSYVIRPGQKK